jgi:hypothetical protein
MVRQRFKPSISQIRVHSVAATQTDSATKQSTAEWQLFLSIPELVHSRIGYHKLF